MRNPLLRRDGITRAEAYMKVAAAFDELLKEIENFSKVNDWERVRQAAMNRRDWAVRAAVAARKP
jgi:hypothetical protein